MYDEMNIEDVGFPDLGFQGKNLYVVCVISIVYFLFFYLKSTFGIRAIIGFRGASLCSWVWLGVVISLVSVGDLWY
jgi:hypothetical protein